MRTLSNFAVTAIGAMVPALTSAGPGSARTIRGQAVPLVVVASRHGHPATICARGSWHASFPQGDPTITVQTMTGASGIVAANHVFNVAPKDGTVILGAHSSMALAQITGAPNLEYDARKFSFIGRIASAGHDPDSVSARTNVSNVRGSAEEQVIVGGTGPTSNSVVLPKAINTDGRKAKIMRRYNGPRRPRWPLSGAR